MNGKHTPGQLNQLADRIEKWAYEAIGHTARALSYAPGSNRYYGARKKAEEAEAKLDKAIEALRAIAKARDAA